MPFPLAEDTLLAVSATAVCCEEDACSTMPATLAIDEIVILLTLFLHRYCYTYYRERGVQQNDSLVNG